MCVWKYWNGTSIPTMVWCPSTSSIHNKLGLEPYHPQTLRTGRDWRHQLGGRCDSTLINKTHKYVGVGMHFQPDYLPSLSFLFVFLLQQLMHPISWGWACRSLSCKQILKPCFIYVWASKMTHLPFRSHCCLETRQRSWWLYARVHILGPFMTLVRVCASLFVHIRFGAG